MKAFGRIDALVSNAGICPFAEFLTMPVETYARTRAVNLDGSFFITQGEYFGVHSSFLTNIINHSRRKANEGAGATRRHYRRRLFYLSVRGRGISSVSVIQSPSSGY